MTMQVTAVQRFQYEMLLKEDGSIDACFKETKTRLVDGDGKQISHAHHRDVISFDELKVAVEKASLQ